MKISKYTLNLQHTNEHKMQEAQYPEIKIFQFERRAEKIQLFSEWMAVEMLANARKASRILCE